jgi:glycosyltransferase involved in cell wall biosynthesis
MHLLFLHQNCPAQFGPLIGWLRQHTDWKLTFCHRNPCPPIPGVEHVMYPQQGGATAQTNYFSRTFENIAHQSEQALRAMQARSDLQPDLILSHSGFVSGLPLQDMYQCPRVTYLEYFYHAKNSDMDFRPEQQPSLEERVRARFRNASLLLDLESADGAMSPTQWQRDRFPLVFRDKIRVIFDGIDTNLWRRRERTSPRRVGQLVIPDDVELVTYAARGFESMRGFDIFMRFAKQLYLRRPKVRFLVVGADRVCYGGDSKHIGEGSFKDWVLKQEDYDLSRFVFLPPVPPDVLATIFSISDLHVYLTVPFVLSWSLLNAMACGSPILASSTAPVQEVIESGRNGLLADFFDVDGLLRQAERLLEDRPLARHLGDSASEDVRMRYCIDVTAPLYRRYLESIQY